uniref:Putative secreted protein n=1 Tax=Ixodes ricinus TaxID=34613 RepID=A0A6B0UPI9_IXORI
MWSTKHPNQILLSLPVLSFSTLACRVTTRRIDHKFMSCIQIFEEHDNLLIQGNAKGGLASNRIVCLLKDVGFLQFNFHFHFRGICFRIIFFRRIFFRRNYFLSSKFEVTSKYFPGCIEGPAELR